MGWVYVTNRAERRWLYPGTAGPSFRMPGDYLKAQREKWLEHLSRKTFREFDEAGFAKGKRTPKKAEQIAYHETRQKFIGWNKRMARRTYTIELKVDLPEGDPHKEAMLSVVKQQARDLVASAMLLADGGKIPQVVAFTEDTFHDSEEISILEPSNVDVTPQV